MNNNKNNQKEEDIEIQAADEAASEPEDPEQKEENNVENSEAYQKLLEENARLKNEFLRAYADAENTKKRCAQEMEKNSKYAIASFAKELLSVADNLNRAITAVDESKKSECETLLKGVEMTSNELTKVFSKFGIEKMDILGKHFDPNYHRVIQEVEDKEKEPGTVVSELQTGYMINDRILREAMVVVTKK